MSSEIATPEASAPEAPAAAKPAQAQAANSPVSVAAMIDAYMKQEEKAQTAAQSSADQLNAIRTIIGFLNQLKQSGLEIVPAAAIIRKEN